MWVVPAGNLYGSCYRSLRTGYVIVAGGVEMMSGVPMGAAVVPGTGEMGGAAVTRYDDQLQAPGFNGRFDQGAGAELIAREFGFSRTQLDEYSLRSHELAAAAQDQGLFTDEIVPVKTVDGHWRSTRESVEAPRWTSSPR